MAMMCRHFARTIVSLASNASFFLRSDYGGTCKTLLFPLPLWCFLMGRQAQADKQAAVCLRPKASQPELATRQVYSC